MSSKEVEVAVAGLAIDPEMSHLTWIFLTEKKVCPVDKKERVLDICTKHLEVVLFIVNFLKKIPSLCPKTHDLIGGIVEILDGEVEKVVIDNFVAQPEKGISGFPYYEAKIVIKKSTGKLIKKEIVAELVSSPSDAIAIAFKCGCPIYVVDDIFGKVEKFVEEAKLAQEKNLGVNSSTNVDLDKVPDNYFSKC